jgi:hypothetical protein
MWVEKAFKSFKPFKPRKKLKPLGAEAKQYREPRSSGKDSV